MSRPRLLALCAGAPRKLTVIRAPAGWGKSTLLAEWHAAEAESRRFAWLTLDRGDNDQVRFWTYLIEALRTQHPDAGTTSLAALESPRSDIVDDVLPALSNELATSAHGIVLVLDDYHLITNPQIQESVAAFVGHLPRVLELALATRSAPALPLARLRARGELVEIDARTSASRSRTRTPAQRPARPRVDHEAVERLQERTEGWAAGLYLASLTLRGREDADAEEFVREFAGDDRHVVDYLSAEVLGGQPAEVRPSCCAPRCSTASARPCATRSPRRRRGRTCARWSVELLPHPARQQARWYRYHHLFAELLRQELALTEPASVAPSIAGRPRGTAIRYAVGGHPPRHGRRRHRGSGDADPRPLDPGQGPRSHGDDPGVVGRPPGGRGDRRRAARPGQSHHPAGDRPHRRGRPLAGGRRARRRCGAPGGPRLRGRRDRRLPRDQRDFHGNAGGILRTAATARGGGGDSGYWHSALLTTLGTAQFVMGQVEEAALTLEQAIEAGVASSHTLALAHALGWAVVAHVESGRQDRARRLVQQIDAYLVAHAGLNSYYGAAMPHIARGVVHHQDGRLAEADHELARGSELARRGAARFEVVYGLVARARLTAALGDPAAATAMLRDARLRRSARCQDPGRLVESPGPRAERATRPATDAGDPPLVEVLSDRELAVLRLLADRPLPTRDRRTLSSCRFNTVKTHMRSVFRKLDVSTRAAAVRRARSLGLI